MSWIPIVLVGVLFGFCTALAIEETHRNPWERRVLLLVVYVMVVTVAIMDGYILGVESML